MSLAGGASTPANIPEVMKFEGANEKLFAVVQAQHKLIDINVEQITAAEDSFLQSRAELERRVLA